MKEFMTRQPILTTGKDGLGYELLFRAGAETILPATARSFSPPRRTISS